MYYVEKLSSTDLMDELKKKGKRHSDYTRALIKDKLSDKDNEIATTSCKVSLACPLGNENDYKVHIRPSSYILRRTKN